uniref:Sema domain-containing protein n=1 Tax=Haemonchus placei TaxID=6290 RepID=A0A0N4WUG5_HAEPC
LKIFTNKLSESFAGDLLAKQTLVKYSPTQAYCVYSDCSDSGSIPGDIGRPTFYKPFSSRAELPRFTERENRRLLPIYVQFHTVAEARPAEAHLIDRLSENALGRFNLELKKNVTHDSFESDSWRDEAGFIVTDRNRFAYVTFSASSLLSSLTPSNGKCHEQISKCTAADLDALCDFDHSVCGFSRDEAYVVANSTVYVAKGDGSINGMLVFALYAETMEIAHALLKHCIVVNSLKQVSFFTREDVWECKPISSRPAHRRHTRAVPSSIKWTKVYAVNMGFHIV